MTTDLLTDFGVKECYRSVLQKILGFPVDLTSFCIVMDILGSSID